MSIDEDIQKGQQAQALLENEILQEIFANMRDTLTSAWSESPDRDVEGRERIYLMKKTVDTFEEHLKAYVNTGKFASHQLELKHKKSLAQKAGLK